MNTARYAIAFTVLTAAGACAAALGIVLAQALIH